MHCINEGFIRSFVIVIPFYHFLIDDGCTTHLITQTLLANPCDFLFYFGSNTVDLFGQLFIILFALLLLT